MTKTPVKTADPRVNLHATAIVAGGAGVLIFGPSGSGKSSLALRVIELLRVQSSFATLIADDRVWISAAGNQLIAEAPQPIAGLVEIRGFGPAPIMYEPRAIIDRAVRLVPRHDAPRLAMPDCVETILDLELPCLDLAEGDAAGGARALLAWLEQRTYTHPTARTAL